nr:MAG TPA: hypothetical protein [Caudoviricetes sp.]
MCILVFYNYLTKIRLNIFIYQIIYNISSCVT